MATKIYLLLISLIYFGLAVWCSVQPAATSAKVGFDLKGASGQSEFMTVYGGLEFGIALVFLCSIFRDDTAYYGLLACVLIHGSLVLFRTISFFCYSGIGAFTYQLAIGEWIITLLGLAIMYINSRGPN